MNEYLKKLAVHVPEAHAAGFRDAITSDNMARLMVAIITISVLELGVLASSVRLGMSIWYFPLAAVLFSLPVVPLLMYLRRQPERVVLKRALVHLCFVFYLAWACCFTWYTRTSVPGTGVNILFSPYMLTVYGLAILFYLEPAWSLAYFLVSFGLFMAMVPVETLSRREVMINMWNALALNLFAWITSRLFFAFRLRTFLDRALIQEKNAELEKERNNLRDALANVKQLSGLLPICSSCKKVRDDKGYWQQVEEYVTERSKATFSHGLCPDCVKKIYPGMK